MRVRKNKFKQKNSQKKPKSRKEQRKEKRQQKKIKRANYFNKSKSINNKSDENKVNNASTNKNLNRLQKLKAFADNEKEKALSYKKLSGNKIKKHKSFSQPESDDDNEDSSSFKVVQSSATSDRMARLQAFVNQEANKVNGTQLNNKEKNKKVNNKLNKNEDEDDDSVKMNEKKKNFESNNEDDKEINRYGKLIGIKKAEKRKKFHSSLDWAFDMNGLLQDIDKGSWQHYKEEEETDVNDLEGDFLAVQEKEMETQMKYSSKKRKTIDESDEASDDYYFDSSDDEENIPIKKNSSKKVKFANNIETTEKSKVNTKATPKSILKKNIQVNEELNSDNDSESISEAETMEFDDDDEILNDENMDSEAENEFDEDDECSDDENCSDNEDNIDNENKNNHSETNDDEQIYKEDIYGRLIDNEGKVIKSSDNTESKYVPPALRKLMLLDSNDAKKKEKLQNLKRCLKGLFNRLAEENMAGICSQIEGYYSNNSKNDVNETITGILMESLVSPSLTPERLLQEHALLVSILTANVGIEVSSYFIK